jgi:hypothetical protein
MIISSRILRDINSYIRKRLEYYNQITLADQKDILLFLQLLQKKYNVDIKISQFIEMRNIYMLFLSKTKGIITSRYGNEIINAYNNKESIISISKKYNLPPINILYQILIELKNEFHIIKNLLKHTEKLPKDIQYQMDQIILSDPQSWIMQPYISIYSNIIKLNTPFEYTDSNKKPNILFVKPYIYKKIAFKWIHLRYHILFDNDLLLSDIKKIEKYNKFGKGLILYTDIICSRSFLKKININVKTYDFFD